MSSTTFSRLEADTGASLDTLGWTDWWRKAVVTIDTWNRRHRTRRQLADVEARILRDVGISEAARFIEINKSFWEE
jgi:uncharacterized protein YjiS (DUF1127 family)